jgi:hypothetical protein
VGQGGGAPPGTPRVHAGGSALPRWRLRLGEGGGQGRSHHLRHAGGVELGPGDDALHGDGDENPIGVVRAQPPVPKAAGARLAQEADRAGTDVVLEHLAARMGVEGGPTLHQDIAPVGGVAEPVLAGVVGERHPGLVLDPLELAPEPERGREAHRAGFAVAEADRRHRGHHRASRGGHVRDRAG